MLDDNGQWRRLAGDGPFFIPGTDEVRDPFYVPFDAEYQILLWVADAAVPQSSFGIILPRSCCNLVSIGDRADHGNISSNEEKKSKISEGLPDASLSAHYLALVVHGDNAPHNWRAAIHALVEPNHNSVWLVRFRRNM